MKRVFNLIVMDESGSMSIIEKQALVGMNETIDTIKKLHKAHPDMEQHVTLLTFDSNHCRFIYDNVLATKTRKLSPKEYNRRHPTLRCYWYWHSQTQCSNYVRGQRLSHHHYRW